MLLVLALAVFQGARATADRAARLERSRNIAVAIAEGRYVRHMFTGVNVTRDVAYRQTVDHEGHSQTLRLDVYAPTGDTNHDRAAIVWLHSGGFGGGSKSEMVKYATDAAQRGYVGVAIDYRVRPQKNGAVPSNQGLPAVALSPIVPSLR